MHQCPSCGGCCHKSGCQRLNTNDKAMWVLGWNECLNAQPPAPSDTAREYMAGYSDCKEWAGAPNQAQPERAPLSDEQKRILFECVEQVKDGNEFDYYLLGFEAAENAYGIKQGGQHDKEIPE